MGRSSPQKYAKRQREQAKQAKRRAKETRRAERKAAVDAEKSPVSAGAEVRTESAADGQVGTPDGAISSDYPPKD